ncbi:type I glyceraldehyde-3-phosphate dehydrogenase [Candidatus Berkelbacteria bacterium CG_4_9_14_0_2_um_filter_42_30]|uniref:Glyceraldehyde-3-phosphate dehydrogenase n=3 Tax=Candidatus Berkelbacteria TaxID=1618330 RepID=A0A2M7K149_9BACT|nr:MAG: type I glyceraldehyde-3-phosphate dehydrogenase [Candidatus Berkelbacteria bacterium CG11_big_fil_rev_8_21_14_0_20_42_15]PIX29976.1 MAG: type I glyceraldehyde-3-phosphate dehydrogenase [Candidatus Berkelbacteria bacterium CG_4_8_14_3_um_filter_42_13]PJC65601.1 MAG: type I glyceraldehyde-3-phosphate dehydrogenase [Candidatus Berkelbacteria bacterium CG_4_9_14_0_2_um_filter_42_30]
MTKIAINGFGRIGRSAAKIILGRDDLELVAVNDLADPETLLFLLRHDSIYGIFNKPLSISDKEIKIGEKRVHFYAEKEPARLPWQALNIDVVIESTGVFLTSDLCRDHLKAGAKKVVISAPAEDDRIPTYLIGVNADKYQGEEIISNASCTTNCIAPTIKVLNDNFGVKQALLTTIHSYTADQNLVDGPHKDLRRARSAAINIVPTTTGAAKTVTKIITELDKKFDGLAIRVPSPIVSLSDIVATIERPTTIDALNKKFEEAADNEMKNILAVSDEPLVSSDLIGNTASAIIDLTLTNVIGGNLVKVIAWYDNEWGYSCRLVEMAKLIAGN